MRKFENSWTDEFYSRHLNWIFFNFITHSYFSLSDREVGVFYHFITLRYILLISWLGDLPRKLLMYQCLNQNYIFSLLTNNSMFCSMPGVNNALLFKIRDIKSLSNYPTVYIKIMISHRPMHPVFFMSKYQICWKLMFVTSNVKLE